MAQLPQAVQAQGVAIRAKSPSILRIRHPGFAGRASTTRSIMWNYATINLVNELARLPGVGNVTVMGAGEYSMRIWMDPQKLLSFGLVPEDVIRAVRQQSQEVAAGQVGMPPAPKDQAVPVHRRHHVAAERPRPVRRHRRQGPDRPGRPPRPRSRTSARIELGAQTYSQDFKLERQAGRRHRDLSDPRRQLAEGRPRSSRRRWRSCRAASRPG